LTDTFLVRQDKCPRYARDQAILAFSTLEKARAWTEKIDIEEHTRYREMMIAQGKTPVPGQGCMYFLEIAGKFDKREDWEPDNVWSVGDGWIIIRIAVDSELEVE
jgi:hypothetical protein